MKGKVQLAAKWVQGPECCPEHSVCCLETLHSDSTVLLCEKVMWFPVCSPSQMQLRVSTDSPPPLEKGRAAYFPREQECPW